MTTTNETHDTTSPYAIRLEDGYHAALQCLNDSYAKDRAHDLAFRRGTQVKWIRTIKNGVADKLIYGKGAY